MQHVCQIQIYFFSWNLNLPCSYWSSRYFSALQLLLQGQSQAGLCLFNTITVLLEKKLFFNEAIILRKLAALLAKIILGEKKAPIVRLEGVQFIMMYKRIKTEMTFQYSLPWDVCSCSLTAWRRFCNLQLPLNFRLSESGLCPLQQPVPQWSVQSSTQPVIQGLMLTRGSKTCGHRGASRGVKLCREKAQKGGWRSSGVWWEFLWVGVSQKWSRLVFLPPYVDKSSRIRVG